MKKTITSGLLILMTMPSLSDNFTLIGSGTYRLSEFDTLNSGYAMAEKAAFNDIAEQVKSKSLTIQKVDTNGYYTRASWLVTSAVVNQEQLTKTINKCSDSEALCATVNLKATINDEQAAQQLNLLYSNKLLSAKLDQLIKKDSLRESLMLKGESVDHSDTLQRQAKRKELLEFLAGMNNESSSNVSLDTINDYRGNSSVNKKERLTGNSLVLDYRTLLASIKSDLIVKVVSQNIYSRQDGTGSLNVEFNIKSDKFSKLVDWIASTLGDNNSEWKQNKLLATDVHESSWRYELNSFNVDNKIMVEAIQVGLLDGVTAGSGFINSNLDFYAIQYGMNKSLTYDEYDKYPDRHLDNKKLAVMEELSKQKLCIEMKTDDQTNKYKKCFIGGELFSGDKRYSSGWDATVPYVWVLRSDSSVWLSIDLDEDTLQDTVALRDLKFKFNVTIENEETF